MQLPQIVFGTDDKNRSQEISRLVKAGKLRRLLPRVYTSRIEDDDEAIVGRNLWQLIAVLFPDSVISHRTAIEFKPSPKGTIYLTGSSRRVYRWPGATIKFSAGPGALPDDNPIYKGLYVSSLERCSLENLKKYRISEGESRAVDQSVIEERLVQILNSGGETAINSFRDRAREIAEEFGWAKQFGQLDAIVGTLLSTRPADVLKSPLAIAVAFGRPYDGNRLNLFTKLAGTLREWPVVDRPEKTRDDLAFINFAFYESYFSNYIEGTTFRVDEAKRIVFEGAIIPMRREDSHDIAGTYSICSDRIEMSKVAKDGEEFLDILQKRHEPIMQGRPEKLPGKFKINANRAGNTYFVNPAEVKGTLTAGFDLLATLPSPLARAIYMMFLIAEVHPFEDGNGRVARLMMNAELTAAGQAKIIIPTVYRDDYILNLRRLTRKHDARPYVRMMDRAHAFSHWLEPTGYDELKTQLEEAYAFADEGKALVF